MLGWRLQVASATPLTRLRTPCRGEVQLYLSRWGAVITM